MKSAAQKVQSCSQEDVEIFVDKVEYPFLFSLHCLLRLR